jgi:hypothetical protein
MAIATAERAHESRTRRVRDRRLDLLAGREDEFT